MKKLYLPAVVIAAITLASCTRQELITGPTPIQFDTFVGKSAGVQTKGFEASLPLLQKMGFLVQAYETNASEWLNYTHDNSSTEGDFMANQYVKYDESLPAWTYEPLKYWPKNGGKVTFFAYAGYLESIGGRPLGMKSFTVPKAVNATPSFDFEVQDLIAGDGGQIDLLVAKPEFNKYSPGSGMTTPKVSFAFHHVLSKIAFYARLTSDADDNTQVKITKLGVDYAADAVRANGKYTFNKQLNDGDPPDAFPGEWDAIGDTTTYLSSGSYRKVIGEKWDGIPSCLSQEDTDISFLSPTNPVKNNYMMLIPQTLQPGALTIYLEYTIKTKVGDDWNDAGNVRTITYPLTLSLPKTGNPLDLEQGKKYFFRLTFDLEAVTIDAETGVSDWEGDEVKESTH